MMGCFYSLFSNGYFLCPPTGFAFVCYRSFRAGIIKCVNDFTLQKERFPFDVLMGPGEGLLRPVRVEIVLELGPVTFVYVMCKF
jgi:hypothetical protein